MYSYIYIEFLEQLYDLFSIKHRFTQNSNNRRQFFNICCVHDFEQEIENVYMRYFVESYAC